MASYGLKLPHNVSSVREADLEKLGEVLYHAFHDDPLTLYVFLGSESRPGHPKLAEGPSIMRYIAEATFKAGALILQAEDWTSVAIW